MVTYDDFTGIGGVKRKNLHAGADAADLADAAVWDSLVGFWKVPGTVDTEIVTRLGYNVPFSSSHGSYALNDDLVWTAGVSFSSTDFALNAGGNLSVGLYLLGSNAFDEGYVPTPSDIILKCEEIGAGTPFLPDGGGTGVSTPDVFFGFVGTVPQSFLQQNTKLWACIVPVKVNASTGAYISNTTPLYVNARAISLWTNRTPEAPEITLPISGTIVTAGTDIDFAFLPNDPDGAQASPTDYRPWVFEDMSGVQVQYRPKPSPGNPDPSWTDLPICSTQKGVTVVEGQGWYIEGTTACDDPYLGAKALHANKTMKIRCGGVNLKAGYGVLDSGDWQLRARTFDYGHALATVRRTDTAFQGYGPTGLKYTGSPSFIGDGSFPSRTITPDTINSNQVSPWSEPVNIAVTTEVPPPLPISPNDYIAMPEGNDVVLSWKYRNTHKPPLPQVGRQVQIRKRGETVWTTLVSGYNSNSFYNITDMVPINTGGPGPVDGPWQYLTDLGFEGLTFGGFETNVGGAKPGTLSNVPGGHSGSRALGLFYGSGTDTSFNEYPFRARITLRDEDRYLSIKGWAKRGAGNQVTRMYLMIWYLNAAETDILGPIIGEHLGGQFEYPLDFTWGYNEIIDLPIPAGAAKAWVMVASEYPFDGGARDGNNLIDDFSVLGSPTFPVEPDPIPAFPLTNVDPISYPLVSGNQYEWRVRTVDSLNVLSEWSTIARFWVVDAPGSGPVIELPGSTIEGATLGCGTYRIEVFRRGGKVRVGELTQVTHVDWNRVRDDMSDAKIVISGWDLDCGELLKDLQTWAYEIVIWRDNGYSRRRVWEGPITLLTYENSQVTINAKDVIVYLYRRIIKQLMNDSSSGTGGRTVVERAAQIIQNVMAPDDPNVLAYLNAIANDSDALQYRNLPPWSRTAYEEIDDMAANAGLDYTAVGRAILLWGTKNRIGTLPEWRDENLGSSPIVSEYGMSAANVYAVSDGQGTVGAAYRLLLPEDEQTSDEIYGPDGSDETYGLIEKLSSSWASSTEEESGTFTQEGLETIETSFSEFAERSISDSYPPPQIVRVPDNTTLNPNTVIDIQSLVPGVAIPLRSNGTLRVVKSIQKLDKVQVVVDKGKETISVTLSPFNHEDTGTDEEPGPGA